MVAGDGGQRCVRVRVPVHAPAAVRQLQAEERRPSALEGVHVQGKESDPANPGVGYGRPADHVDLSRYSNPFEGERWGIGTHFDALGAGIVPLNKIETVQFGVFVSDPPNYRNPPSSPSGVQHVHRRPLRVHHHDAHGASGGLLPRRHRLPRLSIPEVR